jgi:hypothetical protein
MVGMSGYLWATNCFGLHATEGVRCPAPPGCQAHAIWFSPYDAEPEPRRIEKPITITGHQAKETLIDQPPAGCGN